MVSIQFGVDRAQADVAGMSVQDLLAKLRDGGVPGIGQRLNANETVDCYVNESAADADLALKDGDSVVISKSSELGR